MEDKLYTAQTAAEKVGVSKIYIRKAIKRGQLKATKVGADPNEPGGVFIIKESDLLAWNASRKRIGRPKGT